AGGHRWLLPAGPGQGRPGDASLADLQRGPRRAVSRHHRGARRSPAQHRASLQEAFAWTAPTALLPPGLRRLRARLARSRTGVPVMTCKPRFRACALALALAAGVPAAYASSPTQEAAQPAPDAALQAAVAGSWRAPDNMARDEHRHPAQTLAFFGIRPDMTVVEITPGGGWYTEILA